MAINFTFAQTAEKKIKHFPSIALGMGVLSFDGDIGSEVGISSFGRVKAGYNITVEQRIKKTIGVSLNFISGKIANSEKGKVNGLNFQSNISQVDLNLLLHFDNDIILSSKCEFAPYLSVGVGLLMFDSYTDLRDKNGMFYNYWSDGTIRDIAENGPLASSANFIQRDYKYETKLIDSANNYSRNALVVPIGAGIACKLSENIGFNLGATYFFTLTDWLDNKKAGTNDKYLFANVSLKYTFSKRSEDNSSVIYKSVDFASVDKIDSDRDGVTDENDKCLGTPAGVKTDSKGCPLDKDEDGVFDYLDKENETKKGLLVDQNGVAVSEKILADRQILRDSLATERNQLFNENPSLKFLQELDSKAAQKQTQTKKIPIIYKPADKDYNNYISSSEIIEAIGGFFEGESSYTIEFINDLITYFFEQ